VDKDKFRGQRDRAQREYARIRSLYSDQRIPERMKPLVCTVCRRKRNVPESTLEEGFVCAACKPPEKPSG